jgi:hypothetical protein
LLLLCFLFPFLWKTEDRICLFCCRDTVSSFFRWQSYGGLTGVASKVDFFERKGSDSGQHFGQTAEISKKSVRKPAIKLLMVAICISDGSIWQWKLAIKTC